MHAIYTLARLYPYWAFVMAFLMFELGQFYRRKTRRGGMTISWLAGVSMLVGVGLWFAFRGDLHSDQWIRALFGP